MSAVSPSQKKSVKVERVAPSAAQIETALLAQVSISVGAPQALDYPAWRQRYEAALLPFLTSTTAQAQLPHAAALHEVIAGVAAAQQEASARTFWYVMQGCAELAGAGQLEYSRALKQWFGQVNFQLQRPTQPAALMREALTFIASAADPTPVARHIQQLYQLTGALPAADSEPAEPAEPAERSASQPLWLDPVLQSIYLDEAGKLLAVLQADLGAWRHAAPAPASIRAAHTLAGASGTVGVRSLQQLALALEGALERASDGVNDAQHAILTQVLALAAEMLRRFALGDVAPDQPQLTLALQAIAPALAPSAVVGDELDLDLLPVFLEEGADLLPQLTPTVLAWQCAPQESAPARALLRLLHTLKGSARMVGAARLGQHAHALESRIGSMLKQGGATPDAFELLLVECDDALLLFDQLQLSTPAAMSAPTPAAPSAVVRVRADLLDDLVNQAGEVSIVRSKLDNDVNELRAGLGDFSENLNRLQRQLREMEIQAESQIASRLAISSEREFDPLEFDRFTLLQELTRMMAESVNDIAAFHQNLTRGVVSASAGLALQARLTRILQHDLMRVRMVPFSSISERLLRVVRQSASQLGKQVNLALRGGAVEIDRSVLERMAAPFEHVLRNAVVHGIEASAVRVAAAKNPVGQLLVQVSQQGNEVLIELSDDGAGLDLMQIRARARRSGRWPAQQEMSDAQALDLIFEPGFSTADSVTELAGRGVGMDIVRAEAQALGGRIDTISTPGQGVRFTIRLPLTLALSQVVLLRCGAKTYAVPVIQVEQVLQMKTAALAEAHAAGVVLHHGQPVALHYLTTLLGEAGASNTEQRSSPLLMLCSGQQRLALQVDQVLGKREVVVKNIGPQLERMEGIAGATVLGTGEIVLILNPMLLAQQAARQPDVIAPAAQTPLSPLILVVDDSLTVRRVAQRVLEREGYRVLLAQDGIEALALLQEATPNLLLVDIEMPRMNGFDLIRNVRAAARTRTLPIIMLSSRSAEQHRKRAVELGVNGYFGKPFQEAALIEAIGNLLQ